MPRLYALNVDIPQILKFAHYADDLALLANIPDQTESLLHYLEQVTVGIGLYLNTNKTEFMCFKQANYALHCKPLKSVDQFTHLGSNISSTKSDVNTLQVKAWAAIDRLSIMWKSNHSDVYFFQNVSVSILLHGCTIWTIAKRMKKMINEDYTRIPSAVLSKYWKQHPAKSSYTASYLPFHRPCKYD